MAQDQREDDVDDAIGEGNKPNLHPTAEHGGGRHERVHDAEHHDVEGQQGVQVSTTEQIGTDPHAHEGSVRRKGCTRDDAGRDQIQTNERLHHVCRARAVAFGSEIGKANQRAVRQGPGKLHQRQAEP